MKETMGYHEDPKNDMGIIRARTTGQIRSWEILRELKALEILNEEFGKVDFPGVYLLTDKSKRKVYVGEAKSLYSRIKTHIVHPEDKIKDWTQCIVINDGRLATQSDFNDTVIRKTLEDYLIRLLKANKYKVVSQGEPQNLNPLQRTITKSLICELNFFLSKKNLITKLIEERTQEVVLKDELEKELAKRFTIDEMRAYECMINKTKAFIRAGSKKPKGWQITFRGRKEGSFMNCLRNGTGYLIFSRGCVPVIPLIDIKHLIERVDPKAFEQNTIDIWITFEENDRIALKYKDKTIEVSKYAIRKTV